MLAWRSALPNARIRDISFRDCAVAAPRPLDAEGKPDRGATRSPTNSRVSQSSFLDRPLPPTVPEEFARSLGTMALLVKRHAWQELTRPRRSLGKMPVPFSQAVLTLFMVVATTVTQLVARLILDRIVGLLPRARAGEFAGFYRMAFTIAAVVVLNVWAPRARHDLVTTLLRMG
jgi:hypothetical protein